jgi:hypothetical protein
MNERAALESKERFSGRGSIVSVLLLGVTES